MSLEFESYLPPSSVLSEKLPRLPQFDKRPGHHMICRAEPNGKTLIEWRTSRTTDEALSMVQHFALERHVVIQGYLSHSSSGRTLIPGYNIDLSVHHDSALAPVGRVAWMKSLLRIPSRVYYVVLQNLLIPEDLMLDFLQTSSYLTALVIWEPVDSSGKYQPIITDKFIGHLVRRDTSPDALRITSGDKASSANWSMLPNLTYLELNGTLAFDCTGLLDMLKSRCNPSWLRTGVGLVPNVQLQSLSLHFREAPMDRSAYTEVHELFKQEGRDIFIYEDSGPTVVKPMGEAELNKAVSLMFDTYINSDAHLMS